MAMVGLAFIAVDGLEAAVVRKCLSGFVF